MSELAVRTSKPLAFTHQNRALDNEYSSVHGNDHFIQPKEEGNYFFTPQFSSSNQNVAKTGLFGEPTFFQPSMSKRFNQENGTNETNSINIQRTEDERNEVLETDESEIQSKTENNPVSNPSALEKGISSSMGGGAKMDINTKSEMEQGFGLDFSEVNIHTDSNAIQMSKSIGAKAFTRGNDIYFNKGQYNPSSKEGRHLLAHELTHTVQQSKINNYSSSFARKRLDLKRENNQNSTSRNATIQRITKVNSPSSIIQPLFGMGTGLALGYAAYAQIKKFKKMQAKLSSVRGRINFLRMRSSLNNMLSGGNGQIRFTNVQWARLRKKMAKSSFIVSRASSYSMLGFANTIPSALTTFLSSGMAVGGGVMVAPAALEGLLGSLAGATAIGIGIALAEVLALIAIIALIIYILYLIVVVIIEIVDTIAEAIERLRKVAPILWPFALPMPPKGIGFIMPRTYSKLRRQTNGAQAKLREYLKKQGIKGMHAHHIQPLFLGGFDTPNNVVALNSFAHIAGHASLAAQPQLLALGLKANLYSHHPPMQFFIAGEKP